MVLCVCYDEVCVQFCSFGVLVGQCQYWCGDVQVGVMCCWVCCGRGQQVGVGVVVDVEQFCYGFRKFGDQQVGYWLEQVVKNSLLCNLCLVVRVVLQGVLIDGRCVCYGFVLLGSCLQFGV